MRKSLLSIFIIIPLMMICCCNSLVLESYWKTSEIVIDGNPVEWNQMIQYPKDNQFGIGISNDDKFLYLCLSSWDRQTSIQIMTMGFTVWFETKSQNDKRFGIHFPLGMMKAGQPPFMRGRQGQDPEQMKEFMDAAMQEMEILGPGKNDSRTTKSIIAESYGITARILPSDRNLVYELKIPLNQDSLCRLAINTGSDSLIKLTLETTKPDFDKMGGPPGMGDRTPSGRGGSGMGPGGGMPPGGGGGFGGGMPPGGGMGGGMGPGDPPGGGTPSMPEQFKMELSVKLARNPQ
jgi:hypothetical protein